MDTYAVERLVPGGPPTVRAALESLVPAIWGDRARLVTDGGDGQRTVVFALGADDVDVWLSWELTEDHGSTRVRLLLDELDAGPDPTEALGQLLDMVAATVEH
jgi:hypothetical protein